MKLRTKFGLQFLLVFALITAAVIGLQAYWINQLVITQTTERMKRNIRSAWAVLQRHQDRVAAAADILADTTFSEAVGTTQEHTIDALLRRAKDHWHLDLLAVIRPDGTVFRRADSEACGDRFELPGLEEVLADGEAHRGFLVLSGEQVARAGAAFAARCRVADRPSDALLAFAAKSIRNGSGQAVGILLAGLLMNGRNEIVDQVQQTLFEDRFYKGRRAGTVTIFLGSERVATTVLLKNGQRALGTRASDEVQERVLASGESWSGRAWVVSDWYLSRYDPIRDSAGKVVGILYVGELERIYTDRRRDTLFAVTGVLLTLMFLAFVLMYGVTRRTLKQVSTLDRATQRFAAGDYGARARVRTSDEVGALASSFNAMAETIARDRNDMLQQKEEMERINRYYMDMLGFVSHEFRSPLGSGLLNVQLLLEGDYGDLSAEQREGVSIVLGVLRHLEEITESYLQLARIERGELTIYPELQELAAEVVEPVCRRLEASAHLRKMSLENALPDGLRVLADVNLLRVVYENLVGNAIKYGREGGRIVLDGRVLDDRVELGVWNEGNPIAPERLPRLFEKFQRYDGTELSGKNGTGLGLFIVQQIILRHGGEIHAEPHAAGTRFVFTLPFPPAQ